MTSELLTAEEKHKIIAQRQALRREAAIKEEVEKELAMITDEINNRDAFFLQLNQRPSKPVEAILIAKGYTCGLVDNIYQVSW